jgi:hypothetical protein
MSFKNPTHQDRVGQAADAKQKALEQLRRKPARDEKVVAERIAAAQKREQAKSEKDAAKKAAKAAAAISKAAETAANAPASEAEKKAGRDARYAARQKRK